MLRAVCFKNFVKFKEHQSIVFQDDSPFLLIGENASGKTSVLEGIRRCLTDKLSTSISSSFDRSQLSYFICDFDLRSAKKGRIISGYVVMPETSEQNPLDLNLGAGLLPTKQNDETLGGYPENVHKKLKMQTSASAKKGETSNIQHQTNRASEFYKFAMECGKSKDRNIYVNLMEVSTTLGKPPIRLKRKYELLNVDLHEKLEEVFLHGKLKDTDFESDLLSVFQEHDNLKKLKITEKKGCEAVLHELSENIIFTFPLRSVGPLQWSESPRINRDRQKNYAEAEERCEIIRCFLEDKDEKTFHKETEELYFKRITQSDDYSFELKDGKISLPKGKYELLKTPEGILEAKIFSILMSSKTYKTLILEEPDKGMHPQFIERMLQIIKENKNEKRVLLTTHNKSFITPWTVPYCFVFRRIQDECYFISGKSIVGLPGKENGNMKRLRLLTADHISDILFARKVLFYEGDSEMLFLTELKKQVLADEVEIEGVLKKDTDEYERLQKNLTEFTLINMHTKDNLKFCEEICDKLKIAYIFLVDRDAVFKITMEGKSKDERLQEKDAAKARSPDEWCRKRNELLKQNIFFWIDGTIEDMVREMTTYDEDLSKGLRKQNYNPSGKLFLGDAIESTHVRESVRLIMKHCKPGNDLAEFIRHLQMI